MDNKTCGICFEKIDVEGASCYQSLHRFCQTCYNRLSQRRGQDDQCPLRCGPMFASRIPRPGHIEPHIRQIIDSAIRERPLNSIQLHQIASALSRGSFCHIYPRGKPRGFVGHYELE